MRPSHFNVLLLVVVSVGIAQTRNIPAIELANCQVTSSSSQTRVAQKENILKNDNNNNNNKNVGVIGVGVNANSAQLTAAQGHQLSIEDVGNGDASTVNDSSSNGLVQDRSSKCKQLCGAGLGGAECVSDCRTNGSSPLSSADKTLELCKQNCKRNLGDNGCNSMDDEVPKITPISPRNQNDDQSTTPDWEELCKKLCATGDGGSLCNCNHVPFNLF